MNFINFDNNKTTAVLNCFMSQQRYMEPLERKRKKTFWEVFKELTT